MAVELVDLLAAPREVPLEHLGQRRRRVDAAATGSAASISLRARRFGRAGRGAVVGVELGAAQREQVGGVGLVEHGEGRVEPEGAAVEAQQPVGDGVERAAPRPAGDVGTAQLTGPPQQLGGGPPAEGEQQDRAPAACPSATRRATRAASVVVLPVPAPATISRWPPSCSTAALRVGEAVSALANMRTTVARCEHAFARMARRLPAVAAAADVVAPAAPFDRRFVIVVASALALLHRPRRCWRRSCPATSRTS